MSDLKILFISGKKTPQVCGIAAYTDLLAKNISEQAIQVRHIGLTKNPLHPCMIGMKIIFKLLQEIALHRPSLIHLQYEAFSFGQSYLLPLFLVILPIPLILTQHEVFHRNWLEKFRDGLLAKKARLIIVNDQGRKTDLVNLYPAIEAKTVCVGVGSNLPKISKPVQIQKNLIGFFGFLNAVKRMDVLFSAFAEVINSIPSARLRIVGAINFQSAEFLSLQTWLKKNQLEDKVEWTGAVDEDRASELIAECELMVLPFLDGASPRRGSLQACFLLEKAVLTSVPVKEEPELIGLATVQGFNSKDWSKRMEEILNSADLRRELELTSQTLAKKYSWNHIAGRHLSLYSELFTQQPAIGESKN